jgi:hypothetical protein
MKTLRSTFGKVTFIFAVLTTIQVGSVLTDKAVATNEAHAAVAAWQVERYLVSNGYEVLSLVALDNSENWQAHTRVNGQYYLTTVIVKGSSILDAEDMML